MNQEWRTGQDLASPARANVKSALAQTDYRVQKFTRQRPFVATFLAVGVGFLVGRLVSRSRRW